MHFVGDLDLVNPVIANERHLALGNDLTTNELMHGPILSKGTPAGALMNYDRDLDATDGLHPMTRTPLSLRFRIAASTSVTGRESACATAKLSTWV